MGSSKISVIMPVWNGEKYLREAIESILNQTFQDFEFLILDDGSTDKTREILGEYVERDERIRIITLDHQGIVVALNRGVEESRAGWLARMDCDDIASPERLALQWKAIQHRPEAVLCHTDIELIGDKTYMTKLARFTRSEALLRMRLCFQSPIVHPTVMYKKSAVIAAGGYLPEERHAEDYGLWGRLMDQGALVGLSQPLLKYRVHTGSISKQKAHLQRALSKGIAHRHCVQYMRLSEAEATKAIATLKNPSLGDWLWFLFKCVPRLRSYSFELWAWIILQTLKRLYRA